MTREDMAKAADGAVTLADIHGFDCEALVAAAAELRKTCATCVYFKDTSIGGNCGAWGEFTREDGSGYCHKWEAK